MTNARAIPRRSALLQDRSIRTREQLIDAALKLWSERGFETGVEDTTIDEIVQAAGFTKGTFYFHFAHKEDILLELGYDTAGVVVEEAKRCVAGEKPLDASMTRVIGVLSRQMSSTPPAAVGRSVSELRRRPPDKLPQGRPSIADGFELLYQSAMDRGELVPRVEARE